MVESKFYTQCYSKGVARTGGHQQWLQERMDDLFDFGLKSKVLGGFGYLDDNGNIDRSQDLQTFITCRMTHIYSMYLVENQHLSPDSQRVIQAQQMATHGVASLLDYVQDHRYGGFYERIRIEGETAVAVEGGEVKSAYAHAFVLLAAASAMYAGIDRAEELMLTITKVHDEYFWDDDLGKICESYSSNWQICEDYRGVNATMHTVEAFLAVDAALKLKPLDELENNYLARAVRMIDFVFDIARQNSYQIPEHFTADWQIDWDYNIDDKAHQFRPYGATIGHAMEWCRLGVQAVTSTYMTTGEIVDDKYLKDCYGLFLKALNTWAMNGQDGFVYTTTFDAQAIVKDRMHWVLCEAIGATVALETSLELLKKTGADLSFIPQMHQSILEPQIRQITDIKLELGLGNIFELWYEKFITYAKNYVINQVGLWQHQLNEHNEPAEDIWGGKPDIYHAYQALYFAKNNTIFMTGQI